MVQHGPGGGSIWQQQAVIDLFGSEDIDPDALQNGIQKTRDFLQTAASLELTSPEKGTVNLRVTNLTGHKLPTGYIEGRRMWVNMKCMDTHGNIIKQIGEYKLIEAEIAGVKTLARSLMDGEDTRIYECLPGLSPEQAEKYGKSPGKSFHFVLNDLIVKDTRIPPKGFDNKAFAERGCSPVGIDYADGQYWDEVRFPLPENCVRVEASLIYEPVSLDYIRFLVEENRTDDWGMKLLDVWRRAGDNTAIVVATVQIDL
jgi:hypothetical protein